MLPSKVMSYLFWLAAPLMDSSIVQISNKKGGPLHHEWIIIQSTLEMEKNCQNIPLLKQKISCMNSSVFPCQFQKVVNCPWMLDSTLPCKINPSWLLEFMRIPSYVSIDNSGPVSEMLHSGWSRPKLISFNRSWFWDKLLKSIYRGWGKKVHWRF